MRDASGNDVFDSRCPLCRLALWDKGFPDDLRTELLYQDDKVIIVVDLERKQFLERILAVTRLGHIPCGKLNSGEADYMRTKLKEAALKRWGRERKIEYDYTRHTIQTHEHFQAGLIS